MGVRLKCEKTRSPKSPNPPRKRFKVHIFAFFFREFQQNVRLKGLVYLSSDFGKRYFFLEWYWSVSATKMLCVMSACRLKHPRMCKGTACEKNTPYSGWYCNEIHTKIATRSHISPKLTGWVDLWSKLSPWGYPKWSDGKDIRDLSNSWTILGALKFSARSDKMSRKNLKFSTWGGGRYRSPPPVTLDSIWDL